jgi:translocation and assembly module TamB
LTDAPATPPETTPEPQASPPKRRFRITPTGVMGWCLAVVLVVALIVAAGAGGIVFGALTPQGRLFLEARANGLKIGRFGKLKIEGLSGSIWGDFQLRRLTIADEKGVWVEADNLSVAWKASELFARRFHATRIGAEGVHVLRRPTLSPAGVSSAAPVSVTIDALRTRLELMPAFSGGVHGLYDVAGDVKTARAGGAKGSISVVSLTHGGDFLRAQFDLGLKNQMFVLADAQEGAGGAIAGAAGLPTKLPFSLKARLNGTMSSGALLVETQSGAIQPLWAKGDWTPKGGLVEAKALLTASTLTAPLVKMFGPEAHIVANGAKAQSGLFALDGRVDAENLHATVKGEADVGRRVTGPAGLAVSAQVAQMARIVTEPVLGPVSFDGVLKGAANDWAIAGNASAGGLKQSGYSLARVAGPVSFAMKNREMLIGADLSGTGGAGTGIVGALLGASPKARLTAQRLADGRLLLKDVHAQGSGLIVDASGTRGLLGGLDFSGKATLSNLAVAHPGAKGSLSGSWSAAQGGANKPWVFTVDAKGTGFASGLAEADRLLGPGPRLQAKASLDGGAVKVASASLNGQVASARAAGILGKTGGLNFTLDWNAQGPFQAGPVEIAGKAKGTGAITGSLKAPRADLLADFDSIDLPQLPLTAAHIQLTFLQGAGGTDGQVAITAGSEYGPARAKSGFRFTPAGVDLTDLDADAAGIKALGALSLRKGQPSTADLTVAVGPGVLLTAGTINGAVKLTDSAGGPNAVLDLSAKNAVMRNGGVRLKTAHITANGPLSHLPLVIQAQGDIPTGAWAIDATGVLTQHQPGYELALDGSGRFGKVDFKTLDTARVAFGGPDQTAHMRLGVQGGSAEIEAKLIGKTADVRAKLVNVGLGAVNEDLAGQMDADLTLQGSGPTLSGQLVANLSKVKARGGKGGPTLDGVLKANLKAASLTIDLNATGDQGLTASGNLVLPVEASAFPLHLAINRKLPMQGTFAAAGEIKPVWDLFIGGDRGLSGQIKLNGLMAGTLADPRLLGRAGLTGGAFRDTAIGLKLQDVNVDAEFKDNIVDVHTATAADGHGGTLSGSGRASLYRDADSSFQLDLKKFRLVENDTATVTASGTTTVNRGADGNLKIAGALTIDRADVAANPPVPSGVTPMDVVEINRPGGDDIDPLAAAAAKQRKGPSVILDVTLKADNKIYLRGRGLDLELGVNAHVTGSTSAPVLDGKARVIRGDYDFAGKRFIFDQRGTVILSTAPDHIRLDLTAVREDPSLTATVTIQGTAARPEITLTSSPSLPQDEILSQVLFGASASQLSPLEAAQLASAVSALAGGGGFDLVGGLRNLAGLDRLAFAGGESGMTVAGGKYLTDNVYLEIIGGGRTGPAAQVEWRIRRALSIVSKVASQGDAKLSVRWRRDY